MTRAVDSLGTPDPAKLAAAGMVGSLRYLRNLGRAEVDALHAAGLWVGLIDEYAADDIHVAWNGARNAQRSSTQAEALGAPEGTCIFLTADTNSNPAEAESFWLTASPVLKGAGFRRGFYGGEDSIDHCLDLDLIDVGWGVGASSWSHGHRSSRIALRQLVAQATYGVACDLNDVFLTGWGEWTPIGVAPDPVPTPTKKADMDIVKFADKANLWLHGFDRDGEFFWPIPSPDALDGSTLGSLPTRLLGAGDDALDAHFHAATGL